MGMDIGDVARIVAALSPEVRLELDLRVAKFQHDEAELKARAIAALRAMPDNEVIAAALNAGKAAGVVLYSDPSIIDLDEVARVLGEAGFVWVTGPTLNAAGENRWEVGLRNIATILHGPRHTFEIYDIVDEVRALREELAKGGVGSGWGNS